MLIRQPRYSTLGVIESTVRSRNFVVIDEEHENLKSLPRRETAATANVCDYMLVVLKHVRSHNITTQVWLSFPLTRSSFRRSYVQLKMFQGFAYTFSKLEFWSLFIWSRTLSRRVCTEFALSGHKLQCLVQTCGFRSIYKRFRVSNQRIYCIEAVRIISNCVIAKYNWSGFV